MENTVSQEVYPRNPIREAVIGVNFDNFVPVDVIGRLSLGRHFADRTEVFRHSAQIAISEKNESSTTSERIGYQFKTSDNDRVVTAVQDALSCNAVGAYPGWDSLENEFLAAYRAYIDLSPTETVSRIGVRFVNVIEFATPFADFSEYILNNPQVAPDLPQSVSQFVMQLQIPLLDIQGHLALTQTLMPPSAENLCAVLLDIDVSMQQTLSSSVDNVRSVLNVLHRKKNQVFEASITEKTRELFR